MVTQLLPTVTHLGITEFDFRRISFQQTKSDEVVLGSLILDAEKKFEWTVSVFDKIK